MAGSDGEVLLEGRGTGNCHPYRDVKASNRDTGTELAGMTRVGTDSIAPDDGMRGVREVRVGMTMGLEMRSLTMRLFWFASDCDR
jgi:hypothetical protein